MCIYYTALCCTCCKRRIYRYIWDDESYMLNDCQCRLIEIETFSDTKCFNCEDECLSNCEFGILPDFIYYEPGTREVLMLFDDDDV